MTITIYQKPTCTTCRQVYATLKEAGVDVESVNYYTDPIPPVFARTGWRTTAIEHITFRVADPAWLKRFQVGDKVTFTADKVGGQFTITSMSPKP